MEKRKAASHIFREQNIIQEEASSGSFLGVNDLDELMAPGMPAPLTTKPMTLTSRGRSSGAPMPDGLKSSEELQLEKEPIRVRETGFWIWKRVIVPPNVYVVHTRLGRKEPVTIGLGISFNYNPAKDSYLIVPAAMQTIGIVANGISREKQGINILAYVQWQIDDFSIAYRKLDFSDSRDPLGIVNAQLREQAEAAIKDKIATMSVEEVLTDKKPIITELTTRLREVAERQGQDGDEGLGIKIVTVQIRESRISSQKLWENIQAPFRHEQEKTARISYLTMQDDISQKELQTRQATETREAETMLDIERIKQTNQTEAIQLRLREEASRFQTEQQTTQTHIQQEEQTTLTRRESEQRLQNQAALIEQARQLETLRRDQERAIEQSQLEATRQKRQQLLQTEQALHGIEQEIQVAEARTQAEQTRLKQQLELQQQKAEVKAAQQAQTDQLEAQILAARLLREEQEHAAKIKYDHELQQLQFALMEKEVELERTRQEIRNLKNEREILSELIAQLPELAAHMPEIHELKVLQTGQGDLGFDNMAAFITKVMALAENLGLTWKPKGA